MDGRLTGIPAVLANNPTLAISLGASTMSEVCKLDLDVAEIKKLVGDLADIARCGDAERTAALCQGIQGECIEMPCHDPIEAIIAEAVAEDVCSREPGGTGEIGEAVAVEILAYRRKMAEDKPS